MDVTFLPARSLSSFRGEGPDLPVATPRTLDDLCRTVDECRRTGRDYRLLGRGSNVVLASPPLLIRTSALTGITLDYPNVRAEAGASLQKLVLQARSWGLGGVEWLWSIPGTAGGAAVMNAGGRSTRSRVSPPVRCRSRCTTAPACEP